MGTWGTGITSSDTFKDIYDDFFELFNKEIDIDSICKELETRYESTILDEDESNEYYFALAKAKWECGFLDNELLLKIKNIIETGSELKRWENLGASKPDLNKHQKALNDFYLKLLEINIKHKKPKKIKLRDSIFKKGDCISIDFKNGNYGAALILTDQQNSEFGLNLVLLIDFYSTNPPKIENFLNGFCMLRKSARNTIEPYMQYCYAQFFKKSKYKFDIVDKIEVNIKYDGQKGMYSYGHWNHLGDYLIYINTDGIKFQDKIKVQKYYKKGLFG